jgi:hypothetical protein
MYVYACIYNYIYIYVKRSVSSPSLALHAVTKSIYDNFALFKKEKEIIFINCNCIQHAFLGALLWMQHDTTVVRGVSVQREI